MRDKLNDKLWDGDTLKAEVRDKLLEIAQHFYEFLKIDAPLLDVRITGSMTSYNYGEKSDLDLHILIKFSDLNCSEEMAKNLMMTKRDLYKLQRSIFIKKIPIELYPENYGDEHHSNGIYSVLNDKWIEKPKPIPVPVEDESTMKISRIYNQLISDISKVDDDPELQLDLATTVKNNLVQRRRKGLKQDGITSKENILFKKLRNSNFDKLFDAISNATDKQLSLENQRPD